MPTGEVAPAAAVTRARRALVAAIALILWGFGTHGTHAGTGDEPHYLAIAHSLAFDGDLDVRNNYGAREPLIAGGNLVPGPHVRDTGDGTLRPVHDVGLPLLFAPVVRALAPLVSRLAGAVPDSLMRSARLTPTTLYRHAIGLSMIVLACVLAVRLFDVLIATGAPVRAAFGTTLLLMTSPPLLAYSTLFFTELTSALLAFFVFSRLVIWPAAAARAWIVTGCLTGLLLLVHVRNVGLVAGLAVIAWKTGSVAVFRAARFFGGLAAMVAVRTAINYFLWDTWVTTPHAAAGAFEGWAPLVHSAGMRLVALLVDQEYGLLVYAPVYVLAGAGTPLVARAAPHIARPLGVVTAAYLAFVLLPITNAHGWSGQWCPAGRFLTPVVPFLAIPLFFALRAWPRATAIVVALQIGLSAYLWQHPKLLWNDGNGRAAFCSEVGERLCAALPSFALSVR